MGSIRERDRKDLKPPAELNLTYITYFYVNVCTVFWTNIIVMRSYNLNSAIPAKIYLFTITIFGFHLS